MTAAELRTEQRRLVAILRVGLFRTSAERYDRTVRRYERVVAELRARRASA